MTRSTRSSRTTVVLSRIAQLTDSQGIESLVTQILDAKRNTPDTDVSALEREIDERVYGLTQEEIEIVGGG